MQAWPDDVPHEPLANSFQGEPFRAPYSTEMEDGNFRQRRRSTLRVATLRFSVRMPNEAFDVFDAWVEGDLVEGTLPFLMPVWKGGQYVTRTCRFREPFRDNPGHGLRHRVALVLDVEDY
jgi:hypothetical protein